MVSKKVFILIGSNMGNRADILRSACENISCRCGSIVASSRVYESEPWGFDAEQWFLNQVVAIETTMSPDMLMTALLEIEIKLGRDRVTRHDGYVSRPIDLDILYFGGDVVNTELVTAPHPRLHLRRFTLLPLCDIAQDFVHPVLGVTNAELLDACKDDGVVKKYEI